jgi:PAS domain-containing protein
LNSVTAEIAVLDHNGVILKVNEPWMRFSQENGIDPGKPAPYTGVGVNYLDFCPAGSEDGSVNVRESIQSVLDGRSGGFHLEYPCDSPEQKRWFSMSVTPLASWNHSAIRGAVVTHTDLSARRKAEEALNESRRLLT